MNVTERPWWPIACAATERGLDVLVIDPESDEDGCHWDEDPAHGQVVVVAMNASGWSLQVLEPEPEV